MCDIPVTQAQGVTAVHDMGRADFLEGPGAAWRDFEEVLLPAANDDRLKLRVHAALPLASRCAKTLQPYKTLESSLGERDASHLLRNHDQLHTYNLV